MLDQEQKQKEKIGFFGVFKQSFNPKSYSKIIKKESFGRIFKYFTLFLLLVSLILTLKYSYVLIGARNNFLDWAKTDLPNFIEDNFPEDFRIEDGEVWCSENQPFIRRWATKEEGDIYFIIDTTGKTKEFKEEGQGLLITKDKLITRTEENSGHFKEEDFDLSEVEYFELRKGNIEKGEFLSLSTKNKNIIITQEKLERWSRNLIFLAVPFILIFGFIFLIIGKLFYTIIFSLLSLILNSILKINLRYENLLNIGILALIPVTLIEIIISLFQVKFGFLWVIYLIFLIFGLINCREIKKENLKTS
jgi:hypothetical protein